MYFKHYLYFIAVTLSILSQTSRANNIDDNQTFDTAIQFNAQPANCVALTQGRKCFARIKFYWKVEQADNICLVRKDNNYLIQCWKNINEVSTSIEFESDKKVVYQLIQQQTRQAIAETTVNVSWVHKSTPRKRRWRLF